MIKQKIAHVLDNWNVSGGMGLLLFTVSAMNITLTTAVLIAFLDVYKPAITAKSMESVTGLVEATFTILAAGLMGWSFITLVGVLARSQRVRAAFGVNSEVADE